MTPWSHPNFETPLALVAAYDLFASELVLSKDPGYQNNRQMMAWAASSAMLTLNMAIVEGLVRAHLAHQIKHALAETTLSGFTRRLTEKLLKDVELAGGWENLLKQCAMFFGPEHIKELKSLPEFKSMQVLNTLRNVMAHGTALVEPAEPTQGEIEDEHTLAWRGKLQETRTYLKARLGIERVLDCLDDIRVIKLFFTESQAFIRAALGELHRADYVGFAVHNFIEKGFGSDTED